MSRPDGIETHVRQDVAQEVARIAVGLEEKRHASLAPQSFQVLVEQGSLAHAGLGDQRQESAVGFRAVHQRSERLAVLLAHVQEARVGRHAERLLDEAEVFEEHYDALSAPEGIEASTFTSR